MNARHTLPLQRHAVWNARWTRDVFGFTMGEVSPICGILYPLPALVPVENETMARSHHSQLLNYRQRNGMLFFRVADSDDYDHLIRELKRRIPARARQFSSQTLEWCVNLEYREAVEELFSGKVVISERPGSSRRRAIGDEGAGGQVIWLVLILTAILTAGAIFWARQPESPTTENVVATTAPLPSAATPIPQPITSEATINSAANLRSGPGLLFAVTAQAKHGDRFTPVSRSQDADGFWWLQVGDERWVRSDLVVSAAPGELPLDLSLIPVLE